MAREINLVPDIKNEMIKTLKLRNFIFFLCVVVASASIGITLMAGLIVGGQQLAIEDKKSSISNLSDKVNSFSDLSDFLTIKDQLSNISDLTSDRKVFSRTFDILSAILPSGADTITISELNVDISGDTPTFNFDAQANAGQAPFIDYNVLDSFKKSMDFMHYDYGDYVDNSSQTIPAYCMIETDNSGATFNDSGRIYALWDINAEGCKTSGTNDSSYSYEEYNGSQVVRIWRTPLYNEWYSRGHMSLDGTISGVAHFDSQCITYSGTAGQNGNSPKWEENYTCNLVPNGVDGITIADGSSNGRDSSGELVLRFTASIEFAPEFYSFENHHMLAIAPSGRRNVTDSYLQIQAMFGERAKDCTDGDTACSNDSNNSNDLNSSSSSSSSNNSTNTNSNTNGGQNNG